MMIGAWTGKDTDGDKYRVVNKGEGCYEVEIKRPQDEKWYGGLAGTADWLGLTNVDIEKSMMRRK